MRSRIKGGRGTTFWLRQVVTERRHNHVVESLRRHTDSFDKARPRPGLTPDVGVLCAELEAAPGPVVKAIPEAARVLGESPGVGCAVGERGWSEAGVYCRRQLRVATEIVEQRRSITDFLADYGIEIRSARSILDSAISVQIEFLDVPLEGSQTLEAPDRGNRSIRMDRNIG